MRTLSSSRAGWPAVTLLVLLLAAVIGFQASASHADDDGGTTTAEKLDERLKAIGALSASDVWTTYMLVGATSDHFVKDGYTLAQVQQILGSRSKMSANAIAALEAVGAESRTSAADRKSIAGLVGSYKALNEYVAAVLTFAKSKTREHAVAAEGKRKAAWAKVKATLGI